MSNAQRLLSYGLLSLITSTPIAGGTPAPGLREEEEDDNNSSTKGLVNSEGAWCWREECEGTRIDCLKLTKSLQKTADTLQTVADLHDDSARRRQLATHDALKDVAHPSALYTSVLETHKGTLTRYKEATYGDPPNHDVTARCETVLNTTMAEFDIYHKQKIEDFQRIAVDHLDGEIEFYEQVLLRLKTARTTFDEPQYSTLASTPRKPSIYERELPKPRLTAPPLTQPCPHIYDSAPMRPVSAAIGGMSSFLSGTLASTATSRISVLGKLW
ncbi:hypothetical protein M422DRAFT_179049 [Sphaerobolus stellatus SS14]|uniref:Sorting nexin protein WASP-binding domain-containing protein n=1 Tax=Sphaerobolus stellatus (strain SS14) TaxID=990650 RepID=A0A0C9VGJ9_SPHS4|nr:hypothetical protein M422DRAFT_179049 [Sphaerobolus stellatus SS14]